MTTPARLLPATVMALATSLTAAGVAAGPDGGRGIPHCPNIHVPSFDCHALNVNLSGLFSNALPGSHRTAEDVTPTTSNPTRLCWVGRYANRQTPAVADESFEVRIYNTNLGIPDVVGGPIFSRIFTQSGVAGVDRLELDCLDNQPCPGTSNPAAGGHYYYSIEVAGGLPMSANTCYFIEVACVGSAAAGRLWAWAASDAGNNLRSNQALGGQYTQFTRVHNDRAICVSGGLDPFAVNCGPTDPPPTPPTCDIQPANGHAYDGVTNAFVRSYSPGSIGPMTPPGPPAQLAENFQVAAPAAITRVCFEGIYFAVDCHATPVIPEPTHDIEYFADVFGVPGGPMPIASFRLGSTPGVSYTWDTLNRVSATHPPVNVEPGRCYWLAISRVQGQESGCHLVWAWQLTTSSSPSADRVIALRYVSGPSPGPWQTLIASLSGDTSISNFVFRLDAGPVVAPVCGDCNGNGIPDAQEIAADPTLDCFDRSAASGRGGPDGLLDSCQCVADWNRDGIVNSGDLAAYLTTWLEDVQGWELPADITCDGVTNSSDIAAFITRWLASVSGQTPLDGCAR